MDLFGGISGAKPFLKWAGGKRQLIPAIDATLPPRFAKEQGWTYVEPFVGGGAVLFWILQAYPNIEQAVINDINPDLASAYTVVKSQVHDLIHLLSGIQLEYSGLSTEDAKRAYYLEKRAEFNTRRALPVQNTALLIFLNRTCFNGLYRVNSKNQFNVPFGRYDNPKICDAATLLADSELLQKVTILNGDFSATLPAGSAKVFAYLDPPYKAISATASFSAYSSESFNDDSQARLADFCRSMDAMGHAWLLSNSDVTNTDSGNLFFDELYADFNIQRVKASRRINSNASKRGDINELLISNYSRAEVLES